MAGSLDDPKLSLLVIAALVSRLGGRVEITQADIDAVAYSRLEETMRGDGPLELALITRRSPLS